jgi:hypothetical protein
MSLFSSRKTSENFDASDPVNGLIKTYGDLLFDLRIPALEPGVRAARFPLDHQGSQEKAGEPAVHRSRAQLGAPDRV